MAPLTNRIFFFSWRNSLKSLSWFSLLSLSVQAKRRTIFFLFGVSWLAVWKTGKNPFHLVSSFSPLLGFDHFCSNNQSEEVYFFFFMNICIYHSPILSWIFTFRIASKETKILSYFPHSANTRKSSLHFSLSLPLGCLATKRKEGSLSHSLSLGF
jgi:hypothetical protein